MNRLFANTTRTALDVLVLSLALMLAYAVRFDGVIPPDMLKRLFLGMPYVVFLQYSLLHAYGVPRFAWRFVGLRESLRILLALVFSTVVLIGLRFVAIELQTHQVMARHLLVPLGVIAADLAISFLGITGMRMLYRLGAEKVANNRRRPQTVGPAVRTLLIGAGDAGSLVAKEIMARPDLNIVPVGFIDDDPMKQGQVIHGLTIMGAIDEMTHHLFGHLKVGNDPVLHGPNRHNITGRTPQHILGILAHRQDTFDRAPRHLHSDHAGLVRNNPLPLNIGQGGRGSEINGQVVREKAVYPIEEHAVKSPPESCAVTRQEESIFPLCSDHWRSKPARHTRATLMEQAPSRFPA